MHRPKYGKPPFDSNRRVAVHAGGAFGIRRSFTTAQKITPKTAEKRSELHGLSDEGGAFGRRVGVREATRGA